MGIGGLFVGARVHVVGEVLEGALIARRRPPTGLVLGLSILGLAALDLFLPDREAFPEELFFLPCDRGHDAVFVERVPTLFVQEIRIERLLFVLGEVVELARAVYSASTSSASASASASAGFPDSASDCSAIASRWDSTASSSPEAKRIA